MSRRTQHLCSPRSPQAFCSAISRGGRGFSISSLPSLHCLSQASLKAAGPSSGLGGLDRASLASAAAPFPVLRLHGPTAAATPTGADAPLLSGAGPGALSTLPRPLHPGRRAHQVRAPVGPLRRSVRQPLSARSAPVRPLGVSHGSSRCPPMTRGTPQPAGPGTITVPERPGQRSPRTHVRSRRHLGQAPLRTHLL
ncbi:hypothetical protein NDU88_003444 [Pleurodeles waltl]|uniref:Uncharacterized protein n=1 Tax=Pleurodeles waltl TaxID=8319 RepID=A0AAV7W257_PLEWA|nr:hypothetical protein NDU88_003444 [Pleurodeles waltl]